MCFVVDCGARVQAQCGGGEAQAVHSTRQFNLKALELSIAWSYHGRPLNADPQDITANIGEFNEIQLGIERTNEDLENLSGNGKFYEHLEDVSFENVGFA